RVVLVRELFGVAACLLSGLAAGSDDLEAGRCGDADRLCGRGSWRDALDGTERRGFDHPCRSTGDGEARADLVDSDRTDNRVRLRVERGHVLLFAVREPH